MFNDYNVDIHELKFIRNSILNPTDKKKGKNIVQVEVF